MKLSSAGSQGHAKLSMNPLIGIKNGYKSSGSPDGLENVKEDGD